MNLSFSHENMIYNAADTSACVFLMIFSALVIRRKTDYPAVAQLLAASVMDMIALVLRTTARTMMAVSSDGDIAGLSVLPSGQTDIVRALSFVSFSIGIAETVTHVIYLNREADKKDRIAGALGNAAVLAAGLIAFAVTRDGFSFLSVNLLQIVGAALYLYLRGGRQLLKEFGSAAAAALITAALEMILGVVKLSGIGFALMPFILYDQYHRRVESELADSRARILSEQILLHYIYNSLGVLRRISDTDPLKTSEGLDSFSAYLRDRLESLTESGMIPFEKELEHTRAYLELEQLAGDRDFEVRYDLGITDFMLPPLVLQPIVENAVKYGTLGGRRGAVITISTEERGGAIYIKVEDRLKDRKGAADASTAACVTLGGGDPKKAKSVGLNNVRARLDAHNAGRLETVTGDDGTCVTIVLTGKMTDKLSQNQS